MLLSGLGVGIVSVIFSWEYDFTGIEFSFGVLFVKGGGDLFFRFEFVSEGDFGEENVSKGHILGFNQSIYMFINWN